jgi:hypothetical protein
MPPAIFSGSDGAFRGAMLLPEKPLAFSQGSRHGKKCWTPGDKPLNELERLGLCWDHWVALQKRGKHGE